MNSRFNTFVFLFHILHVRENKKKQTLVVIAKNLH